MLTNMAGYCVMKWTNDGNRLSSHHMKHIIEPKKSFDSYQVGDVGEAAYPGYPGRWTFVILAIGETKAQMEQWLSEFLKENGPIKKPTKNLQQSFTAKGNRPLSIVGDTHRDESPPLETHRDMAGPLVNYKNRSSLVPHRDKSPPPVMDSSHYVRRMEEPAPYHTKRLTERDESPHPVTLEDFGIIGNTTPTKSQSKRSTPARGYTSTPAKQSWSASTPVKRSSATPAKRSSATPAKRSSATPAKRTSATPAKQSWSASTPSKRSSATPAKRTSATPAKQSWSASTPAKRSSATPVKRSSATPAKRTSATPAKRSSVPPAKRSSETPALTPAKRVKEDADEIAFLKEELYKLKRRVRKLEDGRKVEDRSSNGDFKNKAELFKLIELETSQFKAVKTLLSKLFTEQEILSHSVSGKAPNSTTKAKPKFDETKFNLITSILKEKFPALEAKDITGKVQAVQKNAKRKLLSPPPMK